MPPAQELWDFEKNSPPSTASIGEAIKKIDYRKIQLGPQTVFLTEKEMGLNSGDIAKGYAVDKAIRILQENKIKNALINAGGDLKTMGKNSDKLSW